MKCKADSALLSLESLRAFLNHSFPGRVVIMGIGNRLRGDDGAGPELIAKLKKKWGSREHLFHSNTAPLFIDAGESPEDWFIRIVDLAPEVIIVVDAIDLQAEPGSIAVIEPENLPDSFCLSTHRLPLRNLLSLWRERGSVTLVLAIQPETLGFSQGVSLAVKESIDHLVEILSRCD